MTDLSNPRPGTATRPHLPGRLGELLRSRSGHTKFCCAFSYSEIPDVMSTVCREGQGSTVYTEDKDLSLNQPADFVQVLGWSF